VPGLGRLQPAEAFPKMQKTGHVWPVSLLAPRGSRPPFRRASDQSRPPVRRLHNLTRFRLSRRADMRETHDPPSLLLTPFSRLVTFQFLGDRERGKKRGAGTRRLPPVIRSYADKVTGGSARGQSFGGVDLDTCTSTRNLHGTAGRGRTREDRGQGIAAAGARIHRVWSPEALLPGTGEACGGGA